jgi:hypothetical protein
MTNAVSLAQGGSNNVTMRNRIINGAMMIDQRNNGASVSNNGSAISFATDRTTYTTSGAGTGTAQQVSDAPAGFVYSQKITVNSATLGSSAYGLQIQQIEGTNFDDLNWGTANAKPITFSAWVKASVVGTYSVFLRNPAAYSRYYVSTVAISSANTWTFVSVTVPGDTTGTWQAGTGGALQIGFNLGSGSGFAAAALNTWSAGSQFATAGSVNMYATNGSTFQSTGWQVEAGTTATPFENRLYGTELALCQRYYERRTVGSQNNERLATTGMSNGSTSAQIAIQMLVQKRSTPALNVGNLSNTNCYNGAGNGTPTSYGLDNAGVFIVNIGLFGLTAGLPTGGAIQWCWSNASPNPYIEFNSEL